MAKKTIPTVGDNDNTTRQSRGKFPIYANKVNIVVIGVSTGGPNALECVIPKLPANFPVPIVIVQHMPAEFIRPLVDRLNRISTLKVLEATHEQIISPGRVYFAPGGKHLTIKKVNLTTTIVKINDDPPENSCKPAVDVLFRSAANEFEKHTLAVVMTGMGNDGVKGGKQIVDAGGQLIIQDKKSSVVWGMPGGIAEAGFASGIYPLNSLAKEIYDRVLVGRF